MGASSSVIPSARAMSPLPASAFVDDKLRQGEMMIRMNQSLRASFVKYIKDCRWTGFLDNVDCACLDQLSQAPSSSSRSSTWTKFGYKSPHCSGGARMMTIEEKPKLLDSENSPKDLNVCSSLLFHRNGLRAVLIAMLLPHFLRSSGVGDAGESSLTDDWRNEESTVCYYQQVKVTPLKEREDKSVSAKRGRVQEWLVGAAAKFSKSELDEYLADCNASWIRDLLRAMQSLPAAVTLSAVDATKQESKIVYANFGKAGANMHDIYSADCSPGGAVQVANAIFGAKKYKRCLTSYDGSCRLRALKPVFDATNQHVYTLGLESKPFKDPILQLQDANDALSEETFQQVEDLLLLVPLLVRNYSCK